MPVNAGRRSGKQPVNKLTLFSAVSNDTKQLLYDGAFLVCAEC